MLVYQLLTLLALKNVHEGISMSVDSIANQINNTNSLYRPVPSNQLQQNLAHFYERTSSFVQDQLNEMFDTNGSEHSQQKNKPSAEEEGHSRLNPRGMGTLIDIYV